MGSVHPQLDFLATFSEASLESFELSRMNLVANLRKELHQVVDEWIEAEIESRIARWILQSRGTVPNDPRSLSSDRIDKPLPAADAFGAFGRSTAIEGSETTASHSIKNALPPLAAREFAAPLSGASRLAAQ